MSLDTSMLAGQILKALDTGSNLPHVMEEIVDEAGKAPNPGEYVQKIIDQVNIYPGEDYDDDRQQAVALLEYVLKEYRS
jgi:hypothetical protein